MSSFSDVQQVTGTSHILWTTTWLGLDIWRTNFGWDFRTLTLCVLLEVVCQIKSDLYLELQKVSDPIGAGSRVKKNENREIFYMN